MKTLSRLIALVFVLYCGWSCDDKGRTDDNKLPEVTYASIAGTWQLTRWNDANIGDERYMYVIFDRKEHTFEMYQNFDTAKARYLTGSYKLVYDEYEGTLISGVYDHNSGFWNNSYLIGEFAHESMVWTVTDDASDVSVYTRRESVPEEILNGTKADM